jgi:hypothetical protein
MWIGTPQEFRKNQARALAAADPNTGGTKIQPQMLGVGGSLQTARKNRVDSSMTGM